MRRLTIIAGIALVCAAAVPTVAQVMPQGTRITADPAPPPGAPAGRSTHTPATRVKIDLVSPIPPPRQDASSDQSVDIAPLPAPRVLTPVANPQGSQPVVLSARIGEHADRTRFVVETSDPVKIRVFTLSTPNRVVIDMPEVLWRLQGGPQRPTGTGAIGSYRYGLFRPGNSRIVIDLNTPSNVAKPMVMTPADGFGYRVVLDMFPTTQTEFDKLAGWPADLQVAATAVAPTAIAPPPVPLAKLQPKTVVIDAGHGGIDSGTIGVDGLKEKDLVLDEAKRLARELRGRGYNVYLTRDSDVYIPLRERVDINRAHHADLFISLHADSNPDSSVSGASIYTLSEKGSDREAGLLAQKENESDIIAGVDLSGDNSDVKNILIDLAQRDTMNRSSRFAETTVKSLSQATDILPRVPHRSAAFVVLKAPDVPAALIELGYLSNSADCAQMRQDSWRNGVAGAIADAVDRHFAVASASAAPAPPVGAAE